jgi:hypothetical protein
MKRAAVFFAFVLCLRAESFDSLRFLQGEWVAEGGGFSLKPELGGKVLVRRNKSGAHEDLMVIQGGHADYWDNEGHAIRYTVTADGKSAVLISDGDAAGPRYRLAYTLTAADTVSIKFEIAPPGKPFQKYLEGSARRK